MKNRETFNFYRSFFEAGKGMSDADRLAFYDAILFNSFEGKSLKLDGVAHIVFTAIKPTLESQTTNYLNGKKGGRPVKNNPPLEKENNPPLEKKESYKYKEKYKEKEKEKDNYILFIDDLKSKVSIKTKVTTDKRKGEKLFNCIKDKEKLKKDYIAHQLDKKEFSQRITAFMEDYNPISNNNKMIGKFYLGASAI